MVESKNTIISIFNRIIAVLLLRPSISIILCLPTGFMIFGPKEYVDLFLKNDKLPEILNPWIGIIFLFSSTSIIVYYLSRFLRIVFDRQIWWFRNRYDD